MVSKVDLPEPLGPITATIEPASTRQIDVIQRVHLGGTLAVGP